MSQVIWAASLSSSRDVREEKAEQQIAKGLGWYLRRLQSLVYGTPALKVASHWPKLNTALIQFCL